MKHCSRERIIQMRYLKKLVKVAGMVALCLVVTSKVVQAEDTSEDLKLMRVTCYTAPEGALTADGSEPREGIVAGKREWLGCVAAIYDKDMNFIGYYEFRDTGAGMDTDGDGVGDSIKNGKSIDVYRDTLEECYAWIGDYGDYLYVQIIHGEG